ncbi:AI-2E family transporter [Bosea sp. (in: a-proteobacteria)]|uniref:AI-2E family transporter n=1 Tax=Bosea sp. (in: a-proteobacteria) TaxID=1871050 RepID=UPI00333E5A70
MKPDQAMEADAAGRPELEGGAGVHAGLPANWPQIVALLGVVAVLFVAREVFIPLAIAVLLTFALAPLVALIRRLGVPRTPAVLAVVTAAFIGIAAFSFLVVSQLSELSGQLPTYQANILEKVRSLKDAGAGHGLVAQITEAVERVGREIGRAGDAAPGQREGEGNGPMLVQIYSPEQPIQILTSMISPLVGPLATAGLVIVVVIFMLLEREDLRDRFIRLVGYSDLHRTTEALQEAGSRVGRYLLMQLVVNVTYGVPVALGLWWIGIPNAALWGALAIVMRFVPYIGPAVSMVLPLFLAVAVSPGWSLLLWVGALFLVMELVINNVVEPWLYGSRTGLSPLAIIVAAIFWTWLWGPVGLVMSTPLTVCLVVLGKHVPQFQFFEVLLGNEPVLDPEMRLYQRLLANDPNEATDQLEELLEERSLPQIYGEVAIPALVLADRDRQRGVMAEDQLRTVSAAARKVVDNLADEIEPAAEEEEEEPAPAGSRPDKRAGAVLCVGGRSALDDVSATMLAQLLAVEGYRAVATTRGMVGSTPADRHSDIATIAVCLLNPASIRSGRFLVRRLKRQWPQARVGLLIWPDPAGPAPAAGPAPIPEADFVAQGLGALAAAIAGGGAQERSERVA